MLYLLYCQVPLWYEARSLGFSPLQMPPSSPCHLLASFLGETVPSPCLHCPRLRFPHPASQSPAWQLG